MGRTIVKTPDMTGLSFPTESEIMCLNFVLIDKMMSLKNAMWYSSAKYISIESTLDFIKHQQLPKKKEA